MTEDRLLAATELFDDADVERSLRPQAMDDFPGQPRVLLNLRIAIEAAKKRGEALDHQLLYGPPGLGKTTLANIVANEMGVAIRTTSGPAIERPGDLAAILTNLKEHDILFIDEIHRLSRSVEEILYPAMEDFALDLVIGKGPGARSVRLAMPRFTLVGATTRYAMVSAPMRDRFGSVYRLEFYDPPTLAIIVKRSAQILGVPLPDDSAFEIARRSRGTPRIANRILRRVRDYAEVRGEGMITLESTRAALVLLDIDDLGLDETDRMVLRAIIEKFSGGPVGLETIAASISEESDTIMDVYEPFLLQCGFLQRTPRGRTATPAAYRHLGLVPPRNVEAQPALWETEGGLMEIAILVVAVAVSAFMLGFAVRGRGSSNALAEQRPRPLRDERAPGIEPSRALIARLTRPETVQASLRTGNKINAIRAFREQLNCGLKEAKDAVELMERELPPAGNAAVAVAPATKPTVRVQPAESPLPALTDLVSRKLIAALPNRALVDEQLRAGSKIGAIKAFRDQSHCGLREAKEAVELMEREQERV